MTKFSSLLLFIFTLVSLCLITFAKPAYEHKRHERPTVIGTKTEQPNIDLPTNITIPSGRKFKFVLYGHGYQIYQCIVESNNVGNWTMVTPDAYLINDKDTETFAKDYQIVHHYFVKEAINGGRATWKSILEGDKSIVITKPIATNASPDDPKKNVPWLVTQATANYGDKGAFHDITHVIRVNTIGGVAPSIETCGSQYQNGSIYHSEYYTDYWFYH